MTPFLPYIPYRHIAIFVTDHNVTLQSLKGTDHRRQKGSVDVEAIQRVNTRVHFMPLYSSDEHGQLIQNNGRRFW
jgi:hypothetical protein